MVASFSTGGAFSIRGLSFDGAFSAIGAFSLAAFSVVGVFAVDEGFALVEVLALFAAFSVVDAFAVADGFSLVELFGFAATVPFAEAAPLLDAVDFGDADVFSFRFFAAVEEAVVESATDFGAVSGRTAGAHAQAMTIAISGIRA